MPPPDDRLPACDNPRNCVCTEHGDAPPLPYDGRTPEAARADARAAVGSLRRTTIVRDDGDRLHAECRVLVFTDDLHLRFDDAAGVVHLRSASRVGKNDLGVNRRRVERVRRAWSSGG